MLVSICNGPVPQGCCLRSRLRTHRLLRRGMIFSRDNRAVNMSDLFRSSDAQMARLNSYLPKSHGKPRVDDSRV